MVVSAPWPGEDDGFVGERVEAGGDGRDGLLEVGGGLSTAGAAGEEDVAGEEDAAGEIAGAAGGVAGRVERANGRGAEGDLFAIGQRAVDLAGGHDDFDWVAVNGSAGGVLDEVVVSPVVGGECG